MLVFQSRWYDVFWLVPALITDAVKHSSWASRIFVMTVLAMLAEAVWLQPACKCVCGGG